MKDLTPNGIALRIAFLVAAVVTILVFIFEVYNQSSKLLVLIIFPISFIVSYIGFRITVEQFIYKGSTVDLILRLPSGKRISATEFFDEDDETLEYNIGESVWVEWIPDWEVLLPYEK